MGNSAPAHEESIGSLVRGILNDMRLLIRDELALAKVELQGQADRARAAAVRYAIAAAALAIGLVFALVAVAVAAAELLEWPVWAGFLIVALVLAVAGWLALASGRRKIRAAYSSPSRTVSTLRENAAWIARRIAYSRR